MRDLKTLEALEIDYENNKVEVDLTKLYSNIDIPETLSNLLGRWMKKITNQKFRLQTFKPLIWW